MRLFKKSKPLVGLDIGSSAIKAVQLTRAKNGYQVTGFAYEALGPDAIVDGSIMDARVVADSIRKTFADGEFKLKGVAAGVSGHTVIVKRVVVPAATAEEVENTIEFDAEQYVPFEIGEVHLDYEIVGPKSTSFGEPGMEVVLVAARKDKIQNHTNVITLAGRTPEVVDIDALALQNAYEANYTPDADLVIALLNIGASLMNINITKGGMPLLIRDVPALTHMLIMEVQQTFDLFRETYPQESISRVLISGGVSNMAGLAGRIQETFSYPTEVLNPFRSITVSPKVDAARVTSLGPALAVAVGLALRGSDQ